MNPIDPSKVAWLMHSTQGLVLQAERTDMTPKRAYISHAGGGAVVVYRLTVDSIRPFTYRYVSSVICRSSNGVASSAAMMRGSK